MFCERRRDSRRNQEIETEFKLCHITRCIIIKGSHFKPEPSATRSNSSHQPNKLSLFNLSTKKTKQPQKFKMKALFTTCSILLAFLLMFASYDQGVEAGKGHVHIKVWRGPSHGHKKHKFAPWGYKAKVPADDYKHHG